MKLTDAKQYVEECLREIGVYDTQELEELVLWTYDKGWEEGIEDYKKEN